VSNAIGVIEIIIALLLIFSVKFASLRKYAAIGMIVTFLTTLSYLFTTPEFGKWSTEFRLQTFSSKRSDAFRIWFNDFKCEKMNNKIKMKNILILLSVVLGIAVLRQAVEMQKSTEKKRK
jgi:dipeptide/tripeptide permease